MKKQLKALKSLIAIVIAILIIGSVIPAVTFASDSENATSAFDDIVYYTDMFIRSVKDLFQRIVDFFRDIFTCKNLGNVACIL